ncbi:hypothetical protein GSY63_06955 [Mucilaginibacter sp. R11]|uniref:Uncharacterized protein n=1 Tax=Mucilaginibacter agri TaxID=2695265 RepID=A0A965ZFK6_9SPHI|nr:hypothetical protein [Mucilaginibacter agri]
MALAVIENDLLHQSFQTLGFDQDFIAACNAIGINCLADVKRIPARELVLKNGFSYRWLEILSAYLKEKGLLHILQEEPGNKNG